MFVAGQSRVGIGPPAGRDQDLIGSNRPPLALDTHGMRVDQHRARMERVASGLFHAQPVKAFQSRDLAILVGHKGPPVELRLWQNPAVAGRVLEVLRKLRGVDIELLGYAAADDACASVAKLLGDGDALSKASSDARSANTR